MLSFWAAVAQGQDATAQAERACEIESTVADVWHAERTGDAGVIARADRGITDCVEGLDPDRIWWWRAHAAVNRGDYEGAANDLTALVSEHGSWAPDAVLLRVHALAALVETRHGGMDAVPANAIVLHDRLHVDTYALSDDHEALIAAADFAADWHFEFDFEPLVAGWSRPTLALVPIRIYAAHGQLSASRDRTWRMLEDPGLTCSPTATEAMVLLLDGYAAEGRPGAMRRAREKAIDLRASCHRPLL